MSTYMHGNAESCMIGLTQIVSDSYISLGQSKSTPLSPGLDLRGDHQIPISRRSLLFSALCGGSTMDARYRNSKTMTKRINFVRSSFRRRPRVVSKELITIDEPHIKGVQAINHITIPSKG